MSYSNVLEYLEAKFKEERALIIDNLIQGKLYESEYKRLCGVLQGLDLAQNYVKDLAKRIDEE